MYEAIEPEIKVFISYAHADQELRKQLEDHLSSLKYSGKIIIWQDQEIPPGANWKNQINTHLDESHLILLLVSASFIASNYCWNEEVQAALERHKRGEARVVPIILKPVHWQNTPLGQLQVLPTGAKPITEWNNQDAALEDVARGVQGLLDELRTLLREESRRSDKASFEGRKAALVVGVNNTHRSSLLSDLKYAEDGAHEITSILRTDACNFLCLQSTLTGENAETQLVRRAVLQLAQQRSAQDLLLFYFLGHAFPTRTPEGDADIYLVTYDFNEEEVIEDTTAYLSLRWLCEKLYRPDSTARVLVILDCCYAEKVIDLSSEGSSIDVSYLIKACTNHSTVLEHNGRWKVVLTASTYTTPVQERMMTHLLLSALRGDIREAADHKGNVHIPSLYTYLQEQMPQEQLPDLAENFPQTCVLASYPHLSDAYRSEVLQAEQDTLRAEVSKLSNQISEVYGLITDPNFFEKIAAPSSQNLTEYFDHWIVKNSSFDDLHLEQIADFFRRDVVQRQEDFHTVASNYEQSQYFSLLRGTHPTYGALLCFGLNPTQWLPGAFTRCTLWSGNDMDSGWLDTQEYRRDLIAQFESSRTFLQKHLRLTRKISRDERSEALEIPLTALGEALANALMHREYVNQTTSVYVDIFSDRVEITNPGIPPEPMTLELLEEEHKSHPRNPQIARVFYLYQYVEKVGSGIKRMQNALSSAGLKPARFAVGRDNIFKVTFFRPQQAEDHSLLSAPRSALPSIWMIPYARNLFFLGRDELLAQIHFQLQAGEIMALSQPQAISGLGGIGKTQVAVEYAYRYSQEYQSVLWAQAESIEMLNASYSQLARILNLPEKEAEQQEIIIEAVKTWLQSHRSWLLILDNADELALLSDFLPPSIGGHLLITTRASSTGRIASLVEIKTFTADQGAVFLLRRAALLGPSAPLSEALPHDQALALSISQELGGLPLALDQAGAYLEQTGYSLQDYQQIYRSHQVPLLSSRGGLASDHSEPVATTWSLSFERVQQKSAVAAEILQLCAYLAPDAIPLALMMEGTEPITQDLFVLGQAIETLRAYSLVSRDLEARTLSVHRLVQTVMRNAQPLEEQKGWMQRAVKQVEAIFPNPWQVSEWEACERWLPHIFVCRTWIEQAHIEVSSATRLLHQAGYYLYERARYTEAEPLYQRALTIREKQLGPDHLQVASPLNDLANLYSAQGKYSEAEPLYRRALKIWEQQLGPDHPQVAFPLNNLASLYKEQGKYSEAEPLYRRALKIGEQQLGPDHPQVAFPLNNLANLYSEQGKYSEAEPLYQRALKIWEQQLGPDHPQVASPLTNLASLYSDQGKYSEAEPLYRRALKIWEQQLGPDHPDVAHSLNNLASLYKEQGKYSEAEPLYRRALKIWEQQLGPDHPDVASPLNNLATLYSDQGKYNEAEPLYRRALSIREKQLGVSHPHTRLVRNNYITLLRKMGRDEDASKLEEH